MKLTKIYEIAEKNNIEITYASLPLNGCLSFKYKNEYHIGIDPEQIKSTADECVKLAHDIGHCVTDSFYNKYSPLDLRSKHEYKAKAWAIKTLMPFDKLKAVMKKGYEQPWELAEYFNVTEDFVHKALEYYESDYIEDKMKNFQKEKEKECIL